MGLEPTTSSLGSWHSTAELRPLKNPIEKNPFQNFIISVILNFMLIMAQFFNRLKFYHSLVFIALCIRITWVQFQTFIPFLNGFMDFTIDV